MKNNFIKSFKVIILLIALISAFYFIFKIFKSWDLILSILTLSFGVLSIIWTLLAKYSLSPKSTLRLFTNNFLACSISVLSFSTLRLLSNFILIPWLNYIELFFIIITFFFFVLASYYIYNIGNEFGFQRETKEIKKVLKERKKFQ